MPIDVSASGSFGKTLKFLQKLSKGDIYNIMNKYGPVGVAALSAATPTKSGLTARSWTYEIKQSAGKHEIVWKNTHIVEGANIAVLLQYGHGTRTGGYVQGRDYINPAIQPVFDKILADVRKAVNSG